MTAPLRHPAAPRSLAAAILVLAGCATQSDVQMVREESRDTRSIIANMEAEVTSLRQEVDRFRGEVEQIRFQTGQGGGETQKLTARIDALDSRLAAVEQSGTTAPGVSGPGVFPTPGEGTGAQTGEVPYDAPPAIRDGLDMLRRGDAQGAIQGFREYLRRSPKTDASDDAQYWIAEAYYSLRDYNRAILEFNEVLLRYPKGDRVPAALLRQAFAFAELGDKVDARLVLQKLVSEHPATPEAERGRRKLAELSG